MSARPNVLFIIADQHNAKCLAHKGHPDVRTPNLDRLAAEGVRFDNCITQNPICTPSRVSFISGQYCHNHGYYGLSGPNPQGLPTVFGHFRRAGYRTGAVGKIHCPEYWVEDDTDMFHETCGCSVGGRSPQYQAFLNEHNVDEDHIGWSEFGDRGRQSCDGRVSNMSYEQSMEGWSVARAKEFMAAARDAGEPFFMHVSLPKPHQCYTPSEPFWSMYDENELTLPPNADYDMVAAGKAPHLIAAAGGWRERDWPLLEPRTFEAGRLRKLHGYLGNISHCDHAVGELLEFLDANDLADDTIVVYTADHGDYATEHGIMEKAPGICSDAITRIPSIWRWGENFAAGHAAEEIAEAVDLSTTLCSLAGLEAMETADGRDLSPLLQGEHIEAHRIGVTEFAWSRSVRKGRYRLVYYPPEMFADDFPDGFGELYDLEADPWEMKNLYFQGEFASVVAEIERELTDWLVTTTRSKTILPPRNWTSPQGVSRYGHTVNADGKFNPDRIRSVGHRNYL